MKNSVIAGFGEVGQALRSILGSFYPVYVVDPPKKIYPKEIPVRGMHPHYRQDIEILHICFPYFPDFIDQVKAYQKEFSPKYTVIHSTVPPGTSRKCDAIHSPIRGMHPHLEKGIITFVKFLAGEQASGVADYFRRAGIKIMLFDKPETTEAMKLFDTEYYRMCIEFAKRVKRYCDFYQLNYSDVYRIANISYNDGYTHLGHPEFVRPILEPIMTDEIGGHCITFNEKLIKISEDDIPKGT